MVKGEGLSGEEPRKRNFRVKKAGTKKEGSGNGENKDPNWNRTGTGREGNGWGIPVIFLDTIL